jgi:hypothetical protein
MPLPIWLVAALSTVGIGLIRDLINPKPLAQDNVKPDWGDGPSEKLPEDNGPQTPVTEIIRRLPVPIPIFNPPFNPYLPKTPSNTPLPETPPRRIPKEGDGQTGYQSPLGNVLTVKQYLKDREYGRLLWNPLTEKKVQIRQELDKDFESELNLALNKGKEAFARWLNAKLDPEYAKSQEYLDQYSLWAGCAWIWPETIKGCTGDLSVNFGIPGIQRLGAFFRIQSLNAHIGVRDEIPNGYSLKVAKLDQKEDYTNRNENLELIGDQPWPDVLGVLDFPINLPKEFANLPDFDEFIAAGVNDRRMDQDYFESTEENKNINIKSSIDPIELEKNLTEDFKKKYYEDITSIPELIMWLSKQLDGLIGAFPIRINVTDTDLIEEGNQSKQISLPNLSEAIAEMVGQNITMQGYTEALFNIAMRNLQETGSTRIQAIRSHYSIESIADYLGFKVSKTKKKVPFTYNPIYQNKENEKPNLTESLKPTELDVDIEEYTEKVTLEAEILLLLEAARIIKARFWRPVDLENIKNLKDLFLAGKDLLDDKKDKDDKSDFEKFLEKVEDGFVNETGIKDATKPYGRDRNNRPRIKEIGKNGTTGSSNQQPTQP